MGHLPHTAGFPHQLSRESLATSSGSKGRGRVPESALGNFQFYWWAVALNLQVQRLVELYAETTQTGFIGRLEIDGMPLIEEAFSRVKLASS